MSEQKPEVELSEEELLANAEKRAAERAKKAKAAQLERLRLVEKFENSHGPENEKFRVIDCTVHGEGYVVVALIPGADILQKRFAAVSREHENDKKWDDTVAVTDFVTPFVQHPGKQAWTDLITRRPAILQRAFAAVALLLGAKQEARLGEQAAERRRHTGPRGSRERASTRSRTLTRTNLRTRYRPGQERSSWRGWLTTSETSES